MTANALMTTLPRRQQLLALVALVTGLHLILLLASGSNIWGLESEPQKLGPLQTRVLVAEDNSPKPAVVPSATPRARPSQPASSPASAATTPTAADPGGQAQTSEAPSNTPENIQDKTAVNNAENTPTPTPTPLNPPALPAQAANLLAAQVGNFPGNVQINYKLTGQEKGLTYYASGNLKWQTKNGPVLPKAYQAELRVSAFLIGSRIWRSVGMLGDGGLSPTRYSDSWRGERAAHFETDQQRISFSGNSPSAPLQAGAQDQVSLFVQMAAAVFAQNYKPGAELNVQTATARDAVNWTLTYKADEVIDVGGEKLETQRWVCLPRGRFDNQVEMWLAKPLSGLPARIKITQANGSFIDMEMRNSETLPALPN
jgi:hypothetical protein